VGAAINQGGAKAPHFRAGRRFSKQNSLGHDTHRSILIRESLVAREFEQQMYQEGQRLACKNTKTMLDLAWWRSGVGAFSYAVAKTQSSIPFSPEVPMPSPGSVTHWIHQFQAGDSLASQKLWEAYFHRLVGLARKKLQGRPRTAADEEDIALSAFASFCQRAVNRQFPELADRHDLWRLLVTITARKAIDEQARQGRLKHGGGIARADPTILEAVVGREPTPEFAASVTEECQRLLGMLRDEQLRKIAAWKLEGYKNEEIASMLDCAVATVERRLRLIRRTWEEVLGNNK
jgi:DNA-directed RNA polymerase specialized sigma24 family protein